jgi:hypothetical protein
MVMGLSLGSIVSAVADPGALVKDAVNSLLPKNMSVVGSIAGAVVDFQTGRPFQGVQHAFDALRDLPQALNNGNANTTRCGSPEFEPSLPPLRQLGPSWRGTAATLPTPANVAEAAAKAAPQTGGLSGFMSILERALKLLTSALAQAAPANAETPKADTTSAASTSSTKSTTSSDSADETKKSDESTSSSTSKPKSTTSSSSSTKSDSSVTLSKLTKMNDGDFMQAVIKGKIPDEILSDPKAMMQIQTRLNHISEMTRLMSSMMQALHDIQMSVIQNVRV